MLKIITDSCGDLTPELLAEHNISVVSLHLQVDGENYTPGEDITQEQALNLIATAKEMPKTSQPTPYAFQQAYEAAEEDEILCIAVSTKVSGTFNSANLAAQSCPDKKITVHDTLQGTLGQGFQAWLAAVMNEHGHSLAEIKQALADFYEKSAVVVTLEKYDNAIKSGRMNKYAGKIIEKLNIRGIIEVVDGEVTVVDKARGADKTFQKILERVAGKADDFSQMIVGISDFQNKELADKYHEAIERLLHPAEILRTPLNPAIGVYTDKGAVAISVTPHPVLFAKAFAKA